MPLYSYKARSDSGKIFSGEIKIASKDGVAALLVDKGFTPIEIIEKNIFNDVSQLSIFKKKVKVKDLAVFCRQFAIVLEAGVPIATAMDVLREQTLNLTMKSALSDVYDNIQKGIALSESFRQHPDEFPEIMVTLVEAGEISGQLETVFRRLADQFEKDHKLNQKVRNAMTYPIIVLLVATIVIIVLMAKVIPTFAEVLTGLGAELPIYTKILISVSNFFKSFWWALLVGIIIILVSSRSFSKTDKGKMFFSNMAITVPLIKGITKAVMTARFTRTLGTLMSSGVLLIQSLEIVQKVLGNAVLAEKMNYVITEVKKGKGLSQPLTSIKYFPAMLDSMIRIGEESGNMDFTLDKAADFYDQEVETAMQQMTTYFEPIIIIILGAVVGFVIMSVIFPMFSVYQSLGSQ